METCLMCISKFQKTASNLLDNYMESLRKPGKQPDLSWLGLSEVRLANILFADKIHYHSNVLAV